MSNVLYTDLDYDIFQKSLADPVSNSTGTGFSIHCRHDQPIRFQCSMTDDQKPIVLKLLEDPQNDTRGIQLLLRSQDQIAFWEEFQNQLIHTMWKRSLEWFDVQLDLNDVRAMFKPLAFDTVPRDRVARLAPLGPGNVRFGR